MLTLICLFATGLHRYTFNQATLDHWALRNSAAPEAMCSVMRSDPLRSALLIRPKRRR